LEIFQQRNWEILGTWEILGIFFFSGANLINIAKLLG
jgi:hypothetical protein